MADEQKPPVAIRVARPYATEAEFLEREFDTLTRTSVVLLGASTRPQGVVLRFEIVLKGGESILRGEGRVVAYKENAHSGEAGLTLRFTRLDSRSKTLVDRAALLREARARGSASMVPAAPPAAPEPAPPPPAPPEPTPAPFEAKRTSTAPGSRRGPPPLPDSVGAGSAPAPPPSTPLDAEVTQVDAHFDRAPPPPEAAPPPPPPEPAPPSPPPPRAKPPRPPPVKPRPAAKPAPAPTGPSAKTEQRGGQVNRPAERDALLTRLRTRAESLPATRVQEILTKRAR